MDTRVVQQLLKKGADIAGKDVSGSWADSSDVECR